MPGAVEHRLSRLFHPRSGRSLLVPVDDSVISGPIQGLENTAAKLAIIVQSEPQAVLGFVGQFRRNAEALRTLAWVVNVTGSIREREHTRKYVVSSVEDAASEGADCVAVHVNFTSSYEPEMWHQMSAVSTHAHKVGLPVLAIVYPRREATDGSDDNYLDLRKSPNAFGQLTAHGVRVAVDLGADVVKTTYTGSEESFRVVVGAADGRPVFIAGGPRVGVEPAVQMAAAAIRAGASGISFGRNVFGRRNPTAILRRLNAVVHDAEPKR